MPSSGTKVSAIGAAILIAVLAPSATSSTKRESRASGDDESPPEFLALKPVRCCTRSRSSRGGTTASFGRRPVQQSPLTRSRPGQRRGRWRQVPFFARAGEEIATYISRRMDFVWQRTSPEKEKQKRPRPVPPAQALTSPPKNGSKSRPAASR